MDRQGPSGNLLRREKHYFYGDPSSPQPPANQTKYAEWWLGLEFKMEIGDGTSTLQTGQTVYGQRACGVGENCWFGDPQGDTAPAHDTQVCQTSVGLLGVSGTAGQVYTYDQFNNVTYKWEFDYGAAPAVGPACPGSLAGGYSRLNYNTYLTQSPYTDTNVNILGLLSSTAVNPSAGNYANATYTYDQSTPGDAPGIVGHDINYGTGYRVRGNPTTISRFSGALQTNINTVLTYDIAGNVLTVTDQNAHTTTTAYNDENNTYARPVKQTDALGQVSTAHYDYNSGKIDYGIDIVGYTTRYRYDDLLGRLTSKISALGKPEETHISYSYPGAYTNLTQTIEHQDQNAPGDGRLRTDTIYDGFGRPMETRVHEGGDPYIVTTQTYDALGRVATTTNPSRPGDNLGFATTYTYDALGRQKQVTYPDGSFATTGYAGNTATVIDPAGSQRVNITDSLGRLTSVVEDPGGLKYTTTYTYDPLDNLTRVTAGGQTRIFNYDNLGWLTSTAQPESGATSYSYDGVGNLISKTDARNVSTGYSYDPLNRLIGKTYSDGTPAVTYVYGTCPNVRGHLTSVFSSNSRSNYT